MTKEKKTDDNISDLANKIIGKRLNSERIKRGIRQGELAKILGVTSQLISNYEKGRNQIPYHMIVRISFVFNCKCEELIDLSELNGLKALIEDIVKKPTWEYVRK